MFRRFILESPRWLLTRRRTEEAAVVLAKIAQWNSKPVPDRSTVDFLQNNVIKENAAAVQGFEGLKEVWNSRILRNQLAILSWVKVACAIVYYGLSFSAKSLSGNAHLNIVYMALLDLIATCLVPFCCNWVGRKKSIVVSMIFSAVCLLFALILSAWSGLPAKMVVLVTVSALAGRFGVAFCFGSLRLVTLELFPTTLRSSCLGFTTFACYLAGVVAPQTAFLAHSK